MTSDRISPHFYLSELTRSEIALRHGLDNEPGPEQIVHLTLLAAHILEPVRAHFNRPFSPNSGFRAPLVNQLLGSRPTSQHIRGQAVDFEIPGIPNLEIAQWIRDNLKFDQLILEYFCPETPGSGWVHCSYNQQDNRQMYLIFDGKTYREF